MAPYPEEVDVFSGPHSRMKQLVDCYLEKLSCTDFSDYVALESLLQNLQLTFCEFKRHEQIENKYIMKKLKNRLKSLSIHNAAVCNCHSDNKLSDILALVQDGYSCTQKSISEQMNYGLKLQNALEEFTEVFIPHMKEEEEVFQPMLVKYFEYEELKSLKELVIEEHKKWGKEKFCVEEEIDSKTEDPSIESNWFSQFPPEVVTHIFSYLSPKDLMRCTQVCHKWRETALDPVLWHCLYPAHWARGIWEIQEIDSLEPPVSEYYCSKSASSSYCYDEDADIDESSESECSSEEDSSEYANHYCTKLMRKERKILTALIKYLLPKVGIGVQKIILSICKGLTSSLLHSVLLLCPKLVHLDISYTNVTDSAFKGLIDSGACLYLQHLDMAGCIEISDFGLIRLTECMSSQPSSFVKKINDHADIYEKKLYNSVSPKASSHQYMRHTNTELLVRGNSYFCEIEDSENIFALCGAICSNCEWRRDKNLCTLARICQQCPAMNVDVCCYDWNVSALPHSKISSGQRTTVSSGIHYENITEDVNVFRTCLKFLSLSGCFQVTDDGLRYMAEAGLMSVLQHLDVSGCWNLTGPGLKDVVDLAPELLPDNLYYCDHIQDGPYPQTANGCQNLETGIRACCCTEQ